MANDHSPSRTLAGTPGEPVPGLSSLTVERRSHEDLVQVVLEGQLDVYTTPRFREQLRGCDPASTQLVIDLTAVSLLDSAGLGELISLRNEADRGGAALGIVCPHERLTRLFRVTGLRSAFAFGHDLTAVRRALAATPRSRAVPR